MEDAAVLRTGSLAVTNQKTTTTGFGLVNKHDDTRHISPIETSAGFFIQPRSAALSPYSNKASHSRGGKVKAYESPCLQQQIELPN